MFQREGGAASACLSEGETPVPCVTNWEGRENPLVKKFPQANGDINRPNEGDMLSRVEVGREKPGHMGCPEGREGCEFRAEERGRGRSHHHISEESQGLAVQDWTIVNPTGGGRNIGEAQGRGSRQEALLSQEVYTVVHIIVSVGARPREPELSGMSADGVEEGLEQGLVRCKREFSVCHIGIESWDREA